MQPQRGWRTLSFGYDIRLTFDKARARTSRVFRHSPALILKLVGVVLIIISSFCLAHMYSMSDFGPTHDFAEQGGPKEHIKNNRILIYITTHLSDTHYKFLDKCWRTMITKSPLFKQSDFMMFVTESPGRKANMALINSVFAERNITVHSRENPGYQEGAILAFTEAIENHWFDKYDWVIRLNPDVMIRDGTFLLERFGDSRIHGIFADCEDRDCPAGKRCTDNMIHTDFFAVRPNAISLSAVRETKQDNAEMMISEAFSSILKDGADSWVPGAGPHRGYCRIGGESSPVIHSNSFNAMHPACLSWYA